MVISLSISRYLPTKLRQSKLSSNRSIGPLQSWAGLNSITNTRSIVSKGIDFRCFHLLWVLWPFVVNVTTLHAVFRVVTSPYFRYFPLQGHGNSDSTSHEWNMGHSQARCLHCLLSDDDLLASMPTIRSVEQIVTISSWDDYWSCCIPLGRSGPILAMSQCSLQFPDPIKFTFPQKRHGQLDFPSERESVAKNYRNLKMEAPNPIWMVTRISERFNQRYCVLIISSSNTHLRDTTVLQFSELNHCQCPSHQCMHASIPSFSINIWFSLLPLFQPSTMRLPHTMHSSSKPQYLSCGTWLTQLKKY